MPEIAIYTKKDSSRFRYICRQLFADWLGLTPVYFNDVSAFLASDLPKLSYGKTLPSGVGISIAMHAETLHANAPHFIVNGTADKAVLFPVKDSSEYSLEFDFIAMAFHLLARTEEYDLSVDRDALGRFPATASLAYKHQFIDFPILDIWLNILREKLHALYPILHLKESKYQIQSTIDVDYFWAYAQRSLSRQLLSIGKDVIHFDTKNIARRMAVLAGREADPYFCFDDIHALHQQAGDLSIQYFVHVGDWGKLDKPNSWKRPKVQQAIRELAAHHHVGLHPSVKAFKDALQLQEEKRRLEEVLQTEVKHSRQHFLSLQLPATYRALLQAGIRHDHSMGYVKQPGFRAGTARSFRWYDLLKEEETSLCIQPFCVMDGTLKKQLALSPLEGLAYIRDMQKRLQKEQLPFTLLWHNSSLSEMHGWQGWRKVYKESFERVDKLIS